MINNAGLMFKSMFLRRAEALFQHFFELYHFVLPEFEALRMFRRLRQLHHMRGAQRVEQLVHFFLAVAGGLAYHYVAEVEVRAGVGQRKAVA